MTKEERIQKLNFYLDKFSGIYKHHNKNILWNTIEFIQTLLEFSFKVEQHDIIPKFYFGEEKEEDDTTKTKIYEKPLIFLKLNKRCYAPVNDENRKLFTNSEVLLASFPVMQHTMEHKIQKDDGTIIKHPYKTSIFYSDNEFLLTLKTRTLKEQYEILNILERTFNIYAKKLYPDMMLACGIVRMESKELKDKDDLKTMNIYFQMRLKEMVDYDNTYLLKAFYIFSGKEDIFEIDGSDGNFEPIKDVNHFPSNKSKIKHEDEYVSIYE